MTAPTYYDPNCDAVLARYNALDPDEAHESWAAGIQPKIPPADFTALRRTS